MCFLSVKVMLEGVFDSMIGVMVMFGLILVVLFVISILFLVMFCLIIWKVLKCLLMVIGV